jgi:sugar diacid utilization regulator
MHADKQTTIREMVDQIGSLLRRQAALYVEQQKLLDELSALRAEKEELVAATHQAQSLQAG